MSKRRHNFGTKRFKEKSLFIFHARIALKSLILLFVRLIARGARIAVADLENEKGWFQFIVALARRKIFVGHAHFGSREDTYLSHDSASKLPLTLSARDAYNIQSVKDRRLPSRV